jgi:uncharacterized membrane protein
VSLKLVKERDYLQEARERMDAAYAEFAATPTAERQRRLEETMVSYRDHLIVFRSRP